MNLILGGTIWLNVSRKLLSFGKFFFSPFEKMPKVVFKEFEHHSHTHANSTITCVASTHTHVGGPSETKDCDSVGATHYHTFPFLAGDSHTHNFALSYGSANLGSPNWWVHTHSITLVSCTSSGANHTHTIGTPSGASNCAVCQFHVTGHTHSHPISTSSCDAANDAHTHGLGTVNEITGNGDSGQTPQSHDHTISITSDNWTDVVHDSMAADDAANCFLGHNHSHALSWVNCATGLHNHTISGISGLGGENPPFSAAVPRGDGLTWIAA